MRRSAHDRIGIFRLLILLAVGLLGFAQDGVAQSFKGRLLDGTAMYKTALTAAQSGGFEDIEKSLADLTPLPLAESDFTLYLLHGKPRKPLAAGKTDAFGEFEVSLAQTGPLPSGARVVAEVKRRFEYYSMPVTPDPAGATEFKLYKASTDMRFVTGGVDLILTLDDDPKSDGKLLRCRFRLQASTLVGDLYLGSELAAIKGTRRALWRIPIPENAQDLRGSAVKLHDNSITDGWTFTKDGWAIVDSPLPPYLEAPSGVLYKLEYRVPARQTSAVVFPVDFPQRVIQARGIHLDMKLLAPRLSNETTVPQRDPDDGNEKTWDILYEGNVQPGVIAVGLNIDSMVLGEINEHTLKVVGGFVLSILIAVMLGLMLSRSGPRVETILSEAAGEEIIERIAQLDAQFEQGRVTKAEYQSTRARLLSLARYEVPELTPPAVPTRSSEVGALPPEVQDLLTRIHEIEAAGSQDSRKIQERVLLLEELARALRRTSEAVTEDVEERR